MTLHILDETQAVQYSENGSFTNPLPIVKSGLVSNTITKLLYLNNNISGGAPDFQYASVTLVPEPDTQIGLSSTRGLQMKLLSGSGRSGFPLESEWDAVAPANTISFDDGTYLTDPVTATSPNAFGGITDNVTDPDTHTGTILAENGVTSGTVTVTVGGDTWSDSGTPGVLTAIGGNAVDGTIVYSTGVIVLNWTATNEPNGSDVSAAYSYSATTHTFPKDHTYFWPFYVRLIVPSGMPVSNNRNIRITFDGTQI